MKVLDKKKIEYLSKDILDQEFIKTFRPIYTFQLLIASSRINIKDSFVTSPSILQKCLTILSIIGILCLDGFTVQKHSLLLINNTTIYYLCLCVTALQSLTFVCNSIHVRFLNGNENADCFVKLQRIHRCMNLGRNKVISAIMFRSNAVSITFVLAVFCALVGAASRKENISILALLGIVYTQINCVVDIVACCNVFAFFFIHTRFLNGILYNYIHRKKRQHLMLFSKKRTFTSIFPTKHNMRQLAAKTHNFTSNETDVYLKEVLDGFSMNFAVYKFQIFIFCCKLVASCLLTCELILFAARNDNTDMMDILTPAMFTIIDILVALMLVIRCELFLREVKGTKRLAITIMSQHFDGRLREKAKRMLKLIEERPPRLSVYEMWELDANTLLEIFMLVTNLIITQLQFVLL